MKIYITFFRDVDNQVKIFEVSQTQNLADIARTNSIRQYGGGWTLPTTMVMEEPEVIDNLNQQELSYYGDSH